jgi:hypothetical protein
VTTAAPELVTPTVRQTFRRARFWILIAAGIAVIAIGTVIVNALPRLGSPFDPANPGPEGAMALRSVLEQQGVGVTVTDTVASAADASGTLFVDGGAATLDADAWQRLLAGRTRVVVASPDQTALDALLPEVRFGGTPDGDTAPAGCALPLAQRAGSMSLTDVTSSLRSTSTTVCFATSGAGQLVAATRDGVRIVLLADRTAYTNEHIDVAGNAAVALGALGATDRLVWFQQSPLDVAIADGATLQDLTPGWVTPLVGLLLIAGLAAALWRGRRLGPIVVESLPVAVRSRETVEGRARLYNRGAARLRAADGLRIGTIRRIGPALGLSRTASVDEVIAAAARMTGRPRDAVAAILLTDEPHGDRDLVRLSDDLAGLEAAVRAASVPGAHPTTGAR